MGHINQNVCWVSADQPEVLFRQYPQQKACMALLSLSAPTQKCPLNSVFRVDRASQRIILFQNMGVGRELKQKGCIAFEVVPDCSAYWSDETAFLTQVYLL